MNLHVIILLITFILTMFLGIFIYTRNPRNKINSLYMIFCLSEAYWLFSEMNLRLAESFETAVFWNKFGALGCLILAIQLHFILFYTNSRFINNRYFKYYIYVPAIIFSLVDLFTELITDHPHLESFGWTYTVRFDNIVAILFAIWIMVISLFIVYLAIANYLRLSDHRLKQGALFVSIGFTLQFLFIIFSDLILAPNAIAGTQFVGISIIFELGFIGFAVWRYELFNLTPSVAAERVIKIIPDALIMVSEEKQIRMVNKSTLKLLSYSETELTGNSIKMLFDENEYDRVFTRVAFRDLILNGTVTGFESYLFSKYRQKIPVLLSLTLIRDTFQNIQGIVLIARDITEQVQNQRKLETHQTELEEKVTESTKQLASQNLKLKREIIAHKLTEEKLKANENKFKAIFNQSIQYMVILSTDGIILEVNDQIQSLFTSETSSLLGKLYWGSRLWPESRTIQSNAKSAFSKAMLGDIGEFEAEITDQSGDVHTTSNSVFPIYNENNEIKYIIATGLDITERKQTELKLATSEQRLSTAMNISKISIWEISLADDSITFDETSRQHLDIDDDKIPANIKEWFTLIDDRDIEYLSTFIDKLRSRELSEFICDIRIKSANRANRWFRFQGKIIDPDSGRLLTLSHDITEELNDLDAEIQSEKMKTVGNLASNIVKEIKTPLGGILQNLQVLHNKLQIENPDNIEAASKHEIDLKALNIYFDVYQINFLMQNILGSGNKITRTINDLLLFGRKNETYFEFHDISTLIEEAITKVQGCDLFTDDIKYESIPLHKNITSDLPQISCKGDRIRQVVQNILLNAYENLFDSQVPEPEIKLTLELKTDHILLEIEDNGPGMDEKTRKHALEPFFTTKSIQGAGLGLSAAYFVIVEEHSGTMDIQTIPGRGTSISISLPILH